MVNNIKIMREGPTKTLNEKIMQLKNTKKEGRFDYKFERTK